MTLLDRLKTTLCADAHGVVDAYQDRPLLLKQHLRQAEAALETKRARRQGLLELGDRIRLDQAQVESRRLQLDADAELAMESGQDDLARFALRKLLAHDRAAERLARQLQAGETELQQIDEALSEQQVALDEMKQKVALYLSQQAHGRAEGECIQGDHVASQDVELELLRRRNRREATTDSPPETR